MAVPFMSLWRQKCIKYSLLLGSIVWVGVFLYPDLAFAQAVTDTSIADVNIFESIKVVLGVILNILYIIIWPILVLAWSTMDNTLIYGGFINLDRPLFTLWNISRTFSNMLIVAIIIVEVINMVRGEQIDKKKVIINLIVAGVGINASWFVLGALIDISTVATYGIGALPMTTLSQVRQEKMPILMIHSYLNLGSSETDTPAITTNENTGNETTESNDFVDSLTSYNDFINNHVYYSRWSIKIPTCEVYKWYIIGAAQYPYVLDKKDKPMDTINFGQSCTPWWPTTCTHLYCALWPTIAVDLKDFEIKKRELLYDPVKNNLESSIANPKRENEINKRMNSEVKKILDQATSNSWCTTFTGSYGIIEANSIDSLAAVAVGSSKSDTGKTLCGQTINASASSSSFMTIINSDATMQSQWWLYLEELLEKSQWLVWPLVTIYISILDFSNMTSVSDAMANTTTSGVIIEFIMKVAAAICMVIPLIALALVLLMRVGILWAIIAFSPFIVIITVFKDSSVISSIAGSTEKYTKIGNIMWLIFAPVIPVFALGIGMIIIQTLQLRMHEWLWQSQSTWSFLGVNFQASWREDNNPDNNETCADFRWLSQLCYDTWSDTETWSIYNDLFGWIMINILAIGIMRAIMKASFSASTITADLANKTIDVGKNLLSSIPLVPLPGSGNRRLSASNLLSVPSKIGDNINEKIGAMDTAGEKRIEKLISGISGEEDKEVKETTTPAKPSLTSLSIQTKTNIASWLTKDESITTVAGIQKVIQNESAKETNDQTLLNSIGSMTNEELEKFLNDKEIANKLDQQKREKLRAIIKTENIQKVHTTIKKYIADETGVTNLDEAKKFIDEINKAENKAIIQANEVDFGAFTGEKQMIKIKDANGQPLKDQVITYDQTKKEFIISNPTP